MASQYSLKSGLCLIFNHKNYKNDRYKRREGTDKDKSDLEKYFTQIGYQVEIHDDLTEEQIKETLKQYASDECKIIFDILVCFFLTHGLNEKLIAFDKDYPIDLIYNPFVGENCRKMQGKPKLFFIQACQGTRKDQCAPVKLYDASRIYSIPRDDDLLLALSTVPKFRSVRHKDDGAFYIQCLLNVLRQRADNEDIHDILTTVSREMAYELEYGVEFDVYSKQMPIYWTSLRQRLYISKFNN